MEKALERFFSEMRGRLKTAESMRAVIARESSPDFNLLYALGIGEVHLSRLLACLLDPKAEHGQGPLFLRCFLELCHAPEDAREAGPICPDLEPLERVTVSPEHETDKGRRIDILLRSGDGRSAIGIENKPWAGDQSNQLRDYSEYLKRAFPERWLLVYLVGDPERPAPIEGERIRRITYGQLGKHLEAALGGIRSPTAATLTRQFLHYIEREFEGGWSLEAMTDAQQIIEAVKADARHVEIAWLLICGAQELRNSLIDTFEACLSKALGENFVVWRDNNYSPGDQWFGFNIYKRDNMMRKNLFVRLEWERKNFKGCFLAIPTDLRIRENHSSHGLGGYWRDRSGAAQFFEEKLATKANLGENANWVGRRNLHGAYRDWDWGNPRPWAEIAAAGTDRAGSENVVDWFAGAIRDFWTAIDTYFEEQGGRSS
ncbi:MAG TPA: hypothetical protein ENJ83_02510 [Rhodospirillales bacterium]|nr:hypothetical protein [Rhodospirillales bacterium]